MKQHCRLRKKLLDIPSALLAVYTLDNILELSYHNLCNNNGTKL